jgi:hypothetical protein
MIIKLTECRNNKGIMGKTEYHPIYININQIQSFAKSINGTDTRLQLQGIGYIFVRESCEEIIDRLVPKMVTLPDNMDHAYGKDAHIKYGAR